MATLLPPPKRQKVYHGVPEPEKELPKPAPHVVVQFVSEDDGEPLAPAVNLPANVSREGLEAIVNKLNTKVRESYNIKCAEGPMSWNRRMRRAHSLEFCPCP